MDYRLEILRILLDLYRRVGHNGLAYIDELFPVEWQKNPDFLDEINALLSKKWILAVNNGGKTAVGLNQTKVHEVHAEVHRLSAPTAPSAGQRSLWMPGNFADLARFIDRESSELNTIVNAARRALGCGFAEVLAKEHATGVCKVATVIYGAVLFHASLKYEAPPANPEDARQEVRLARQVLSGGFATCLDLALLYAALLESANLAPAIVLVELKNAWHAMGGFFDRGSETKTAQVVMNPLLIRQLIKNQLLILVETTGLSEINGQKKDYDQACKEALRYLEDDRPLVLVNVVAARRMGFRPPPP